MTIVTKRNALRVVWLGSATLVTIARLLNVSDPGYDLGLQLQAAHNLLAGRGLSLYQHLAPNLADPARLITLTYFPSGYSLLAAALMKLGLSVGVAMKVLGAPGTILGWWGWASLSEPFLSEGWLRGSAWRAAAVAIALSTPLLFTPAWGGTDIFLWASVPWVVLFIVGASDDEAPGGWWLDLFAGGLCGFALLMRYASLFLAVYAASIILWQSRLRIRTLTRRLSALAAGLLPALALQGYINYVLSKSPALPGGLFDATRTGALGRLWIGVRLLRHADYLWAFWVPGTVANLLFRGGINPPVWRAGLTLCAVIAVLLAIVTYATDSHSEPARRNLQMAAVGLFMAVPLTLLGCMLVSPTNYVAERRYYWPIVPLALFVAYSMASRVGSPQRWRVIAIFQVMCAAYLAGYVAMSSVYGLFLFVPGRIGMSQREKLVATELHRWPSLGVTHEFSPARQFVMQRLTEHPGAMLLTSRAGSFYWDPLVDGSRLYELNCEILHARYVSGPATLVILTFDNGPAHELWYYIGNATVGSERRAPCFERLPALTLVQRFPEEGLKILEAHVGAGQQVQLKP